MTPTEDDPVPVYVLTGGRARPTRNTLRPETLLKATLAAVPISATRHHRELLQVCAGVLSLAEAAAHLQQPVSVVAVMASDLIDSGHLAVHATPPSHDIPTREILERVLSGLRKL